MRTTLREVQPVSEWSQESVIGVGCLILEKPCLKSRIEQSEVAKTSTNLTHQTSKIDDPVTTML